MTRVLSRIVLLALASQLAAAEPTTATVAGSLQSELGCPDDWQPECVATQLALEEADGIWQASFLVPAGAYEYKAPLNGTWDVNYGANRSKAYAAAAVRSSRRRTAHLRTDGERR